MKTTWKRVDNRRGQFVPILSYSNLLHHQLNKLQLESISLAKDQ